jgi:hypothetical protein
LPELSALVREQLGVNVVGSEDVAPALGLRRFVRLHLDGPPHRLVARIEAPEDPAGRPVGAPPEPPLEPLRGWLEERGLPVPARYGGDPERGIDLLEDLGSESLEQAAARASDAERRHLYGCACALVPPLQRLSEPAEGLPAFSRRLDRRLLAYKAGLFARESLPLALGRPADPGEQGLLRAAFDRIADACEAAPARLSHRDFQSRNLMVRRDADGPRLVMIDLQGAFLAPPEYDLVCLLRDSYVELPEGEVAALLSQVRPALPDAPAADEFARRFALLTLARKAKDHARFLHVARTRGDRRHAPAIARTVRALRRAAQRCATEGPAFAALAGWIRALPEEAPACAR